MPRRIYRLADDQTVYTFQLVGGPKGYYNRQHDRLLVAETPPMSTTSLRETFAAAADRIKDSLPANIYQENGATAALAFIGSDGTIRTANAGDSRVTLFVRHKNGDIEGHQLTRDHNVYNADEARRLEKLKAHIKEGHVWARDNKGNAYGLAVSRALGDGFAKPFVSDEPEILEFNLIDAAFDIQPDDEVFIAVDTDGVHMELSPTYRAGALAAFLSAASNKVAGAAHYLANLAILCGSGDNLSIAFAQITPNRTGNLVLAAFDGHGDDGYRVAESAATNFKNLLGKPAP